MREEIQRKSAAIAHGFVGGFLAICGVACVGSAHAAFIYNEAHSGDLRDGYSLGFISNPPVFTLSPGQNTISGRITETSPPGPFVSDFDAFAFFVPPSTTLSNISLSFSQTTATGAAGFGFNTGVGLPFSPSINTSINFARDSSPQTLFSSNTPLGPGVYTIGDYVHSTMQGFVDYTFTLNVNSTSPPPPPTLPPPTTAPTPIQLYSIGTVDPTKPTVVITHGWQPGPFGSPELPDWVSDDMGRAIHALGANVVMPLWADAFTTTATAESLANATAQVANQGRLLAQRLRDNPNIDPNNGIHFIGHSLGSLVNAYAANTLTVQDGWHIDQFTILDRPFGQGIRPSSITSPAPADADQIIFRTLLPYGDVTWVDNYYGTDHRILATGGTPATGAPFDPFVAFNHAYIDADHTEVHEEYFGTIPSTVPTASTCPTEGGFLCSQVAGGFRARQPYDWDPLQSFRLPSNALTIDPNDWLFFNCELTLGTARCREGSPAYLWLPDFHIGLSDSYLSFDFQWENIGDGDWLTLFFGDDLLFSFAGNSFFGTSFLDSGLIPIGQFAGQTGQLLFTLNSTGETNAILNIRDIQLTGSNAVPEPTSLFLLLAVFLAWSTASRFQRQRSNQCPTGNTERNR